MKLKRPFVALVLIFVLCSSKNGCSRRAHESIETELQFAFKKPQQADIVGRYVLIDQEVIPGGTSALGGRQCFLDLHPGGSFTLTNYPDCAGARSARRTQFHAFVSTSGTWKLDPVGTSYDSGPAPRDCWGIRFDGGTASIDPAAFTGGALPNGLVIILGDPDSRNWLHFRKVPQRTTNSSSAGCWKRATQIYVISPRGWMLQQLSDDFFDHLQLSSDET